jgi:nuclear transcription factor Y, gamma
LLTHLFPASFSSSVTALIHAHTQAQIAAGIYKGDEKPAPASAGKAAPVVAARAAASMPAPAPVASATSSVPNPVMASSVVPISAGSLLSATVATPLDASGQGSGIIMSSDGLIPQAPAPSSSSPEFLAQLHGSLDKFWVEQLQSVQELQEQTEQDFKTHNDLPLARIKRIMKSDEDVRMISAEAPVLFAKACELFILDLSIRSWNYSQLHKRRTLQKEDIREAIQKTDIFDFLVDVI